MCIFKVIVLKLHKTVIDKMKKKPTAHHVTNILVSLLLLAFINVNNSHPSMLLSNKEELLNLETS